MIYLVVKYALKSYALSYVFVVLILISSVITNVYSILSPIYMCGSVVIDTAAKIRPLLEGSVNTTSLETGQCRWTLQLARLTPQSSFIHSNVDDFSFLLSVSNSHLFGHSDKFVQSCVEAVPLGYTPSSRNCEVVYRGDVVKLVNVQVHLSEEDKAHGRGEDWYISRVIPYTKRLDMTLVNVERLEDVFGSEWRSLGVGRGVEWMTRVYLTLRERVPSLRGLFSVTTTQIKDFELVVPWSTLSVNPGIGVLYINSLQLENFSIDAPQQHVEDIRFSRTERLKMLSFAFKNVGEFVLEKNVIVAKSESTSLKPLRSSMHAPFTSFEALTSLSLKFSSEADRLHVYQLPPNFLEALNPDLKAFGMIYHEDMPEKGLQIMPPWNMTWPSTSLIVLSLDWMTMDDHLAASLSDAFCNIRHVTDRKVLLNLMSMSWNVSHWTLDKCTEIYLHLDVLPSPLESSKAVQRVHSASDVTGRDVWDKQHVVHIILNSNVSFCSLEFGCSSCSSESTFSTFILPRSCLNVSSGFSVRNAVIDVGKEFKNISVDVTSLVNLSLRNVRLGFSSELLQLNFSRLSSLYLEGINDPFLFRSLFPCAGSLSEQSECCKSNSYAMETLDVVNVESFPFVIVNSSMFCHMPFLKRLRLENVPVTTLRANFMRFSNILEGLAVKGTKISHIPEKVVWSNTANSLISLDLSRNKILSIDSNFCMNVHMHHLKLSFNSLLRFELEMLSENNCSSSYVDISFNAIEEFRSFHYKNTPSTTKIYFKLESLNLAHNRIQSLTSGMFDRLHYLRELNFSSNRISNDGIQHAFLSNSCSIHGCLVDLSNNTLSGIVSNMSSFIVNTSISVLDLSNNSLSSFPYGVETFFIIPSQWYKRTVFDEFFVTIKLNNNPIRSLEKPLAIPSNKSRVYIELRHCGLTHILFDFFICTTCQNSTSQWGVDLSDNNVTELPVPSDGSTSNVRVMNLQNTHITTFPCSLKASFPLLKYIAIGQSLNSSSIPSEQKQFVPRCCHLKYALDRELIVRVDTHSDPKSVFATVDLSYLSKVDALIDRVQGDRGICSYTDNMSISQRLTLFSEFAMNASLYSRVCGDVKKNNQPPYDVCTVIPEATTCDNDTLLVTTSVLLCLYTVIVILCTYLLFDKGFEENYRNQWLWMSGVTKGNQRYCYAFSSDFYLTADPSVDAFSSKERLDRHRSDLNKVYLAPRDTEQSVDCNYGACFTDYYYM